MPITVTIPGGTAEILGKDELTARRQRAIEVVALLSAPVVKKVQAAGRAVTPDGQEITAAGSAEAQAVAADAIASVHLTEDEAALFFKIQDASIYAHLLSWTLPAPRPDSIDAVQDMPVNVYEALREAVNDATQADPAESFEPNDASLENPDSPSGSSGN